VTATGTAVLDARPAGADDDAGRPAGGRFPTSVDAESLRHPELFPVFLKLAGRRVLVVGAGPVAASKIGALVAAGADVRVVAPDVRPEILERGVRVEQRPFEPRDLEDAWFVVAAATPEVNREVARLAEARRVFVNAVDDPPNASAYLGGIVRKDGVTLAISTAGHAPALAGLLREALERVLPDDLARWTAAARAARVRWKRDRVPMEARRPLLLRALNALYGERATAEERS
jgi:uroporphyrin-III C-methyltransferase/precorrin-2 dehydrogenase/sirohydrochlorin ferrochelatase